LIDVGCRPVNDQPAIASVSDINPNLRSAGKVGAGRPAYSS
jgi:hypothetical protein